MNQATANEVARLVGRLLGRSAEVWPGHRQPAIRVTIDAKVEARAEADGFWQVHFFDSAGMGIASTPTDVPEATNDVKQLAEAIASAIRQSPHWTTP